MKPNQEPTPTIPTTQPEASDSLSNSVVAEPAEATQITSPVFIASCVLLPVVWGVLVHMFFNKWRRNQRPGRQSDSGRIDYQI